MNDNPLESIVEPNPAKNGRKKGFLARIGKFLAWGMVLILALILVAGMWFYSRLRASLPQLDGEIQITRIEAPVEISRDTLGIPTIQAQNRLDAARALGFLHAQERFFQMDLQRKRAAGELSELFGGLALNLDRRSRIHRFRHRAQQLLEEGPESHRRLSNAYTEGVNAGLKALGAKPFEYLFLRAEPAPWQPEDSYLTVFAMYVQLQDSMGAIETDWGLIYDSLPASLAGFLLPAGGEWDTSLSSVDLEPPPIPTADDLMASLGPSGSLGLSGSNGENRLASVEEALIPPSIAGSNSWAVAAEHTADGGALVANDMHLPLSIPNIWYRASMHWTSEDGESHQVMGVTLPGTPLMVIGSNTHVAWGFTNSAIDNNDVVLLDIDPADENRYLTASGPRQFQKHREIIRVKGGEDDELEVVETHWGPVLPADALERSRSLRWVAYLPGAVDFDLMGLETARNVQEALDVASISGLPALNITVADRQGQIGWTIVGAVPGRVEEGGRIPALGRNVTDWAGPLAADQYPRMENPPVGRLWTANNRVVEGEDLARLGDGGYALGARAQQIRDRLLEIEKATVADMLDIQLDDRALFLQRWQTLLLEVLDEAAIADDPRRQEARQYIENWGGRAAVDSVGYRIVRIYRAVFSRDLFGHITARCKEVDEQFAYRASFSRFEIPLWQLIEERPLHFLKPDYETWESWLLAIFDATLDEMQESGLALSELTWGARNTLQLRHPLSGPIPGIGRWVDMPREPVPGDDYMPRVQTARFGASQRMVVSPGREDEGIFHMPGGQSGHPLSPFYGNSQEAWVQGEPTPFLPGSEAHHLRILP